MCCIFTWMAWCFDASHRVVVFIMACLISTSVCCLLLVASLAGVAMGYNYSLAEYIDLKETNISVYIKRGIYDDEVSDTFDWRGNRRSGEAVEPNIQLRNPNIGGAGAEGEQSGRRSGLSSAFESDEQNKYEGGLMRLTSTSGQPRRFEPPEPPYLTSSISTTNIVDSLLEEANALPSGSKQRLQVIQAAAKQHEARKIELATASIPEDPQVRLKAVEENAVIHSARRQEEPITTDKYEKFFGPLQQHPGFPGSGLSARKFLEINQKDLDAKPPDRLRDAVFRGSLSGWPQPAAKKSDPENFIDYDVRFGLTMPTPVTPKPLLVRPTDSQRRKVMWDNSQGPMPPMRRNEGQEESKYTNLRDSSSLPEPAKQYSDYDESHGLPVRKKRNKNEVGVKSDYSKIISSIVTEIDDKQNDLHAKTFVEEYDHFKKNDDTLPSDVTKESVKRLMNTENMFARMEGRKTNYSNLQNKSFGADFDTTATTLPSVVTKEHTKTSNMFKDIDILGKQAELNSMKSTIFFKELDHKNEERKHNKRRINSDHYEYKLLGNKESKSISDGKRYKIVSRDPQKSNKKYPNTIPDDQSTLISKLVTITIKNLVDGNQLNSAETTKMYIDTSIWSDHLGNKLPK